MYNNVYYVNSSCAGSCYWKTYWLVVRMCLLKSRVMYMLWDKWSLSSQCLFRYFHFKHYIIISVSWTLYLGQVIVYSIWKEDPTIILFCVLYCLIFYRVYKILYHIYKVYNAVLCTYEMGLCQGIIFIFTLDYINGINWGFLYSF